jgi:hypothetical protein
MDSNERLTHLIKLRLKSALKNAEILPHAESIYIFNRKNSEWYFIINSNGELRFNSKFFDITFLLFSMDQSRYSKVLKEIVEKSFNYPIRNTQRVGSDLKWELNIVTSNNRKDWDLKNRYGFPYHLAKKYLDIKNTSEGGKWYFTELF